MTFQFSLRKRQQSGQALVEGAVALLLIIVSTIYFAYLLLNAGITSTYKQKLGVVTARAAQFASSYAGSDVTQQTKITAENMIDTLGIGNLSPSVTVTKTQIAGLTGYIVKVSGRFSLLGNNFGSAVTLSDQAAATVTSLGNTEVEIPYNLSVSPGMNESILVPGFRANTPVSTVAAGRARYLLNQDAGWIPSAIYGLSSPSEAPVN